MSNSFWHQDPSIFGHEQLHKSLMEQLLRPLHWAKAPLRSGNVLQEDVVADVVELLCLGRARFILEVPQKSCAQVPFGCGWSSKASG